MARYRKVDSRIWNDEKFRCLSDDAKLVFFMLLTHPNMTALGAMRATLAGLAEELGWDVKAFREAFGKVLFEGMAEHDAKACFIALPNFLRYNPPESPNVVKAWVGAIDLLPECEHKTRVIARSHAFAKGMSEAFAKALPKAFSKGMPYQEQEQEQDSPSLRSGEGAGKPAARPKREEVTLKTYLENCRVLGKKPIPLDHPIRAYCSDAGITVEMLQLGWIVFKDRFTSKDGSKRQRDWPAHFSNSVKSRWYSLWTVSSEGAAEWTSTGLQEKRVAEARMKPNLETAHEPA